MLTVQTNIQKSKIHGMGLFAGQDLEPGDVVWRFDSEYDDTFGDLLEMGLERCTFVLRHCYRSPRTGLYVLPLDGAIWMNFDEPANTEAAPDSNSPEDLLVASRYIYEGEELTVPISSDLDATWKISVCHTPYFLKV